MKKILTALITPFDENGNVDDTALICLVKDQIKKGVDGFVICGTTGEAATLSKQERLHVLDTVIECNQGRVELWYGCGTNNTQTTIEALKEVEEKAIQGVLLVVPYYNRPNQTGLCQHFEKAAHSTKHAVMLYNVPKRCGVGLELKSICYLIEHCANIKALKHASCDLTLIKELHAIYPSFQVYSGEDSLVKEGIACGMCGIVSVMSHIILPNMRELLMGKEAAGTICKEFAALCFCDASPAPVKYMLYRKGFCTPKVRLPLVEIDAEKQRFIDQWLQKNDNLLS